MTENKLDAIMPNLNGKSLKFSKLNENSGDYAQIRKNGEQLFSQRLKAMVAEDLSIDKKSFLKPGEAGLNPVKPKLEKQGGVRTKPVFDGNDSGESLNKPVNVETKAADNTDGAKDGMLSGEKVSDTQAVTDDDAESFRKIVTDNRQMLLMQLKGLFAPEASTKQPMEVGTVQQGQAVADTETPADILLNIAAGNNVGAAEEISKNAQYEGTLSRASAQDTVSFGDVTVLTINEKGIFIGGEGDSLEDASNYADGNFLKALMQGLSDKLKNKDGSENGEETADPEKMLLTLICAAVSQMNDPAKQEDEYQKKLIDFLMKFVDRINGREDEKSALSDSEEKEENEGNLLLQLIENLVEAADKTDEETSAAVYTTAFGFDILYFDDAQAQSEETESVQPLETKEEIAVNIDKALEKETVDAVSENTAEFSEQKVSVNAAAANNANVGNEIKTPSTESAAAVKPENSEDNAAQKIGEQVMVEDAYDNTADMVKTENSAPVNAYAYYSGSDAQTQQNAESVVFESISNVEAAQVKSASPNLGFKLRVKGASEEMDELKRLFGGLENKEEDRIKEKNEILSESEENTEKDGENQTSSGNNRSASTGENKDEFSSNIIESVSLENIKIEAPTAKTFVPDENAAKQVIGQIVNEMLNNMPKTERTVTTLTMTLNPETLGKITMKVSQEAGKVSLLVTAHNRETAELLSSRLDAAQQAVKDSGTQLEKYQVVYAPQQESRAGQQNYEGSSKNPYVRQDNEEQNTDGDGKFAQLLQEAV